MKKIMTIVSALGLLPLFSDLAQANYGYSKCGGSKSLMALGFLVVAYWLLTLAAKQSGYLKKLGNSLAILLFIVAVAGLSCAGYHHFKNGASCPMQGSASKASCHYTGNGPTGAPLVAGASTESESHTGH